MPEIPLPIGVATQLASICQDCFCWIDKEHVPEHMKWHDAVALRWVTVMAKRAGGAGAPVT